MKVILLNKIVKHSLFKPKLEHLLLQIHIFIYHCLIFFKQHMTWGKSFFVYFLKHVR
jgi:hypothetical protein